MKVFVENRDRHIYGGRRSALAVGPHYHSHFEIIYMLSGHSLVNIDGCVHNLQDGDLVVALPYQVHHIEDLLPSESYLFIVPDNICEEYQDFCNRWMPISPVIHNIPQQPQLHELLTEAIEALESEEQFSNEIVKGLLIIVLGLTFRQMEFAPLTADSMDTFRQIVKYCTENFDHPISLQTLSEQFYLSRFQISRLFAQNVSMSFPRFLAGIRVMEACRMLRSGSPITETAVKSGFASIRSFNRCFMDQTGMTPKEYKRVRPPADYRKLI